MGEFELIRQFFQPLSVMASREQLILGPGDDCAIQRVPADRDLVFSVDTLVEGAHFPHDYPAFNLGWRSLAVAASDLAAMGASPVCFTLALTLPAADERWLSEFARGLARASETFRLSLAGGDTTRGPLTLSLQVHGTVPAGGVLRRSGARVGDRICVTGPLGNAGAALDFLGVTEPSQAQKAVLASYHFPRPPIELAQALIGAASAAIDISDGLLADLNHILSASGVGASIDPGCIPLSKALVELTGDRAVELALSAGDDYELCVCINDEALMSLPEAVRSQLTTIGRVEAGLGLRLEGGRSLSGASGYDHFGRSV